jgi:hypothetical protein
MVPEQEEFDLITPIGTFINWGCNQSGAADVAGIWVNLIMAFKSDNYGGRYCIDISGACLGINDALAGYFWYFQCDGSYDGSGHRGDGILSKYSDFAKAFGDTCDPSKPECYYVAAKNDGASSSDRRKEDILSGIGEDFTLNCDGGVGNTRKVNVLLQLLLLTEIAERGTATGDELDCRKEAFGYNFSMVSKFYKLMSEIME